MGRKPENTTVQFWRDDDLQGVELRYSSYHKEAFRKHTHAAYSVGLVEKGNATFWLQGETQTVQGGQLVVIPPNVAHACNPDVASVMSYWMFYIDPKYLIEVGAELSTTNFPIESSHSNAGKGPSFLPAFSAPVMEDSRLFSLWQATCEAITNGNGPLEKQSCLLEAIATLILAYQKQESLSNCNVKQRQKTFVSSNTQHDIKQVQIYIQNHLADKIHLNELAHIAGLSAYHFLRIFRSETGLPPHAYQNQLRVDRGKMLLAEGCSISQVSADLGFSDQSHFTRIFRQYTGATPKQYSGSLTM